MQTLAYFHHHRDPGRFTRRRRSRYALDRHALRQAGERRRDRAYWRIRPLYIDPTTQEAF